MEGQGTPVEATSADTSVANGNDWLALVRKPPPHAAFDVVHSPLELSAIFVGSWVAGPATKPCPCLSAAMHAQMSRWHVSVECGSRGSRVRNLPLQSPEGRRPSKFWYSLDSAILCESQEYPLNLVLGANACDLSCLGNSESFGACEGIPG